MSPLFSLRPSNDRAEEAVMHHKNSHLISTRLQNIFDLDIQSQPFGTLATVGREADVFVEGDSISDVQCSFEVDQEMNAIVLYDMSNKGNTRVSQGERAIKWEGEKPRRRVVLSTLITTIAMGGRKGNLVQFQLVWHVNPAERMEIETRDGIIRSQEVHPPLRTLPGTPAQPEAAHPPGIRRAILGQPLGSSAFGTVHEFRDMDGGKLMAVKRLKRPESWEPEQEQERFNLLLKREVEALCQLNHVSRPLSLLMRDAAMYGSLGLMAM
jgi:hypothetical protein